MTVRRITPDELKEGLSPLFLFFVVLGVTTMLISNIIAGKLISVGGIVLPAAVILFPVTYIMSDVMTEVYGYRRSMIYVYANLGANILMTIFFTITVALPHPPFWQGQEAYRTVLGYTPRLVLASFVAYFLGDYANSAVLSWLKVRTKGRFLFFRTIGSTAAGQVFDTALFITLAFVGTVPLSVLLQMIVAQYVWKVGYEIIATPATYMVVNAVKRFEGIDVYDYKVRYSPFNVGL